MKKTLLYFAIVFGTMAGCKKNPLDITPDGRIEVKDVFRDRIKTGAYLNTVYSSIPTYFYRYWYWTFLAGITDEAQDGMVGVENSNISGQWINGALTTSYNPLINDATGDGKNNTDHYFKFWAGIYYANVFLENIGTAAVDNEVNRSRWKAEAQLLRAFYYWELIKQFGPMPVITTPFSNTFDYTTLTRPSFQEVVDFIVSNCDSVIANPDLPTRITLESERGRFSKAVAYAIKSEATLYNASPLWNPGNDVSKWKAAAEQSRKGIDVLMNEWGYALAADYGQYFLNRTDINTTPLDKETIYEVNEGVRTEFSVINGIPSKAGTVKAGVCPTQELVDSYDMQATGEPAITGYRDNDHLQPIINAASGYKENDPYSGRDPRFYATVWYNGAQYDNINGRVHTVATYIGGSDQLVRTPSQAYTCTGYYLRKFIDPRIQVWTDKSARWKKYRLAELLLNFAEAENEAVGPTAEVYAAIKRIRERAGMPGLPPGLTRDEMRTRIRRERRVELAIEEHRFWDVRRWKILEQTDKSVTGMQITKLADGGFSYQRFVSQRRNAWQAKYLVFPIPQSDASIIPDFGSKQNPGW